MKRTSIFYIFMLSAMITGFFMFTGGITDVEGTDKYTAPTLSDFALTASSPVIYAKLPFTIHAQNNSYYEDNCNKKTYYTTRDLVGGLTIRDVSGAVVETSNFTMTGESGAGKEQISTGTFVDTVVLNRAGTYTATATFYDSKDSLRSPATSTIQFTVGNGSAIPLSAGTYRLTTFTVSSANGGTAPYVYTNPSTSNTLVINPNGVSASLEIDMQLSADALTRYPALQSSSYNYSATGSFSVYMEGPSKYFKIDYEKSAEVSFNFTFDGTTLTLNYTRDGTNCVMKFVKV